MPLLKINSSEINSLSKKIKRIKKVEIYEITYLRRVKKYAVILVNIDRELKINSFLQKNKKVIVNCLYSLSS